MDVSYETAFEIAKQKKALHNWRNTSQTLHDEGSTYFLGVVSAKKMQQVSLSNNTIQGRISKMSMDVKEQVLAEIKASLCSPFSLMNQQM